MKLEITDVMICEWDAKTNWISVPDFIAKIRGEYKENKVNVSEHKHKDIV